MVEKILITDRASWLRQRRNDVTASTVAALFGVHPYISALKLYLMHRGIDFDNPDNAVLRRGRLLEPAAAVAVNELRPDYQLYKNQYYYRDADLRLGATPDYHIGGDARGPGVLQIKTAAPGVFEREWENGKRVPLWIQLQTITEAMLTGAAFAAVAVLKVDAFDLDCVITDVPLYPGALERIRAGVIRFWDDVAAGREPDPDYNKDAELLALIAPHEIAGKAIDLSGDNALRPLLEQRAEIMALQARYQERKDEIETELKFKMRDAERVTGLADWAITWKTHHRDQYTMPAKDIRTLRINRRTSG